MSSLETRATAIEKQLAQLRAHGLKHARTLADEEAERRYFGLSEPVLDCLLRVVEWLQALEEPGHANDDFRLQWLWLGLPEGQGVPPLTSEQQQAMTLAITDFGIGQPPMSGEQLLCRLRAIIPGMPAEGLT